MKIPPTSYPGCSHALIALLGLSLLLTPLANAGIPIEQAQRAFQARYCFLHGRPVAWPACECGTPAPPYPEDKFYGDLDENKALACQLVQHLAGLFYGASTQILSEFLNTTNGSIEGLFTPGSNYGLDDFPPQVAGATMTDVSTINTTNYAECFASLYRYIKQLQFVSCDASGANLASRSGSGVSTNNCDEAINYASSDPLSGWNRTNYWEPLIPPYGVTDIGVTTISWHTEYSNAVTEVIETLGYTAKKNATRGQISSTDWDRFLGFTSGTISVFVCATNKPGGVGPNSPPFAVDGRYRLLAAQTIVRGDQYLSALLADSEPGVGQQCQYVADWDQACLDPMAIQGWSLTGARIVLKPDFSVNADAIHCGDVGCSSCGGNGNLPGSVEVTTGSLNVRVSLGPDGGGRPAGYFLLHVEQPSAAMFHPSSLFYSSVNGVGLATDNGGFISTPNVTATIQTTEAGYTITFRDNQNAFVSSVAFVSNSPTQMSITETLGANGQPRTLQCRYLASPTPTWEVSQGNGLRTESRASVWSDTSNRVDTILIKDVNGRVASQTVEQHRAFPWGLTLIQRIAGTGTSALTNSWSFYDDPATDGASYGLLKQAVAPGGRWEQYRYDGLSRLTNRIAQFANNASTSPGAQNRETAISYAGVLTTTIEKLLDTEVSRTYRVHLWDPEQDIQQVQTIRCIHPGAAIGHADNLTNIVWTATGVAVAPYSWAPLAELRPDGTMTIYQYTWPNVTVQTGAPDWTWTEKINWTPNSWLSSMDGTQTTLARGWWGEVLSVQTVALPSWLTVAADSYAYAEGDTLRRSHTVTHLDSTTESYTYACCGLDTWVDRDGVATQYLYDQARRRTAMTRLGITTTNVLDAAGNILQTSRVGTDSSTVVVKRASYDLAGQITAETNALGGVTFHTNQWGGGHLAIVANPDGGTGTEAYNQDGTLQSTIGTAVFPARHVYGVAIEGGAARPYTAVIKLDSTGADSLERSTNYTDLLGRTYKTVFAGPGAPSTASYWNRLGQLTNQTDPDSLARFFAYGRNGERTLTVVDFNRNGTIDLNGPDRVSLVTNDVVQSDTWDNTVVRRERVYAWDESGQQLVAERWASADGLHHATIAFGQTNMTHIGYAGQGLRYVTNTIPCGAFSIESFQSGRLSSVARFDGQGNQVSAVTYTYDAHGRQNTATDARNGAASVAFNDADLPASSTTPSPDGIQSGLTTRFYYDTNLRRTNTTEPDQGEILSSYHPNGLLRNSRGTRTYPAGDAYDPQGRLAMLTNWAGFPTSGVQVTRWSYDAYRGWLTNKTYDSGTPGPTYAHTFGGAVAARTSARGISATNTYNGAGEAASVSYSDATAGLSFGYDRLGRRVTVTQGAAATARTFGLAGNLLSEAYSGGPLAGLRITNGYDEFLRRTNLALLNAQGQVMVSTSYRYDGASRLLGVTAGTNSAAYTYLANSSLIEHIDFTNVTAAGGGVLRMTTTKAYDRLNRLTSIGSSGPGMSAVSFTYGCNAASQRTNVTLADGLRWTYQYDALGQLSSARKRWPDGTFVAGQQFEYGYDSIGNRVTNAAGGDASGQNLRAAFYTNNSLNQVTARTVPGYAQMLGNAGSNATVTLWAGSNWWASTSRKGDYYCGVLPVDNSTSAVWLCVTNLAVLRNGTNADLAATNYGHLFLPKSPEVCWPDADGNLTNDGRWVLSWDAENRLTKVESRADSPWASKRRIEFKYDAQWRRTEKIVYTNNGSAYFPQLTNRFVYDGWNLVAVLDGANSLISSFTWGTDLSGTLQGAGGVGGLLFVTMHAGTGAGSYFCCYDGSGNVAALIDPSSGGHAAKYEYGAFGEVLRATGPMAKANLLRFSSKYEDEETGFLYYGYRYYSARTGRWLTRDPIGERGGMGLYGFAYGNPVGYCDYLGREGYWSDVGTTFQGMGQGALAVGKDVGYFAGDLLLGFIVVVVPDCCCDSLLTKLDDLGYKGSSMTTGAAGEYGGIKTAGRVFIAPVVAAASVPVNGYQSVQAALDGDLRAAGNRMGQALATGGLLAAPLAKGAGGTGGYSGVGTFGEAAFNLTPTLLRTLPEDVQLAIRARAGARAESCLIRDMGPNTVSQLQIYPRQASGRLTTWWFTADGVCLRNGGFLIREFKASAVAPLSANQSAGFPLVGQFGGAVRGVKGASEGIPQGTLLAPTRVQVVRQVQFQWSELALPAMASPGSEE